MPVDEKPEVFEAFGFKVPLPRWAVSVLATVVITAVGVFLYQKVYDDPVRSVLTLKQVNDDLAATIDEYGRHAMEEPEKHELFTDPDGSLAMRVYRDHCVLLQRNTRQGTLTKLIRDLARDKPQKVTWQVPAPSTGLMPVVSANACTGGCLQQHPGAFKWWYGARNGMWVEVWRQWPDGCTHVQLFNPQTGAWDTNGNGSPRVRWSCCVH